MIDPSSHNPDFFTLGGIMVTFSKEITYGEQTTLGIKDNYAYFNSGIFIERLNYIPPKDAKIIIDGPNEMVHEYEKPQFEE